MGIKHIMNHEEYVIAQEGRSADGAYREMSPWAVTFFEKYFKYVKEPILEIGCGNGAVLEYLKDKGIHAIGIDISRLSIWHCINHEKPVSAILQDAQEPFPFPDNTFKTVITFHTLEHMPNPEKAINEAFRVLDGNFCGITPITEEIDLPAAHFAKFGGTEKFKLMFKDYKILETEEIHPGLLLIANNHETKQKL